MLRGLETIMATRKFSPKQGVVPKIGFIGQGFIGKNMADDFTERGYLVVRYALEGEYRSAKEAIADCDIVFVAVPTPTRPNGFDDSALRAVLPLIGKGKIVVIKSTILPGTTQALQREFTDCIMLHAPEFLREKHAAHDTRHPERTIIGVPELTPIYTEAAEQVIAVLPPAPYVRVCRSSEAELIKYTGNAFLATKVIFMNLIYDLAVATGADYAVVAEAVGADSRIGRSHMQVLDSSGHAGACVGRGAGGHCFPKDLAALRAVYADKVPHDHYGLDLLRLFEAKNRDLLSSTGKDQDLLAAIYGE
jgi:UDPglucose 6-dehydrogenase